MMDVGLSGSEFVFVYGTLKRSQPNHWMWEKEEGEYEFIGEAETVERFPMIISRMHNLPLLFKQTGVGCHIQGEVYRVDKRMLERLDLMEHYPDLYDREIHAVIFTNHNTDKQTVEKEDSSSNIIQSELVLQSSNNHRTYESHEDKNLCTMKCWLYCLSKYPSEVLQKFPLVSSYDCCVTPLKILQAGDINMMKDEKITAETVYDWLLEDCKHV